MSTSPSVFVSTRALRQRLVRRLAREGARLHAVRARDARAGVARHVVVRDDAVVRSVDDLAAYARELGVLRPWERLA